MDVKPSLLVTAHIRFVHQSLAFALRMGGDFNVESCDLDKLSDAGLSNPDVILVAPDPRSDIELAVGNLQTLFPRAAIACMLLGDDEPAIAAAIRAGAKGIIEDDWSKSFSTEVIVATIRKLMDGETVIPAAVILRLVNSRALEKERAKSHPSKVNGLSQREREVLGLLAKGLSNKEIAVRLAISDHTIRSHMRGIMQKLQVNNRVQAAALVWNSQMTIDQKDGKELRNGHSRS